MDESKAMLPRQTHSESSPPPDLKSLSFSVSFNGWRMATSAFKSWALKMFLLHKPTWQKAGIFEAVMTSTKEFNKNTHLLLGIAERWCPETNTFLFPWGEATVTLEDVMVLLGFSVLGSPVFAPLVSSGEKKTVGKLRREWVMIKKDNNVSFVTQATWMGRFMDSGDDLEHVAFLVLWLSYFVFPSRYYHMDDAVFSVALHLSRGVRIALAPAVLAHLYSELTLLKNHIRGFDMAIEFNAKLELSSLFKLVQVWTWERFSELRPSNTNLLLQGEPRLGLWEEPIQKRTMRMRAKTDVRKILANSEMDSFEWRPYTKAVRNWKFPQFYPERAMWVPVGPDLDEELISFARCVKVSELVGIHSVERYFHNRVASQFGLLQDVPSLVVNRNNLSIEAAWDEYNKPIDGLRLYIPSRSAVSCCTSVFCEWWRKDSGAVELADSSTPRNIIRGGDDGTSEPVPCCSKKRKSMKRVCKKDETHMDLYQTHVPSEKDEEDDSLTIGQIMRVRKKDKAMCSSDENPPKVLALREVLQKMGKEFPEKLKRSRYLRKPTNVRSEIADSGGSASREVLLNELFQKEAVLKRKSEHLGDNQAREDDEDESCKDCYNNITTAEMVIDKEKGARDASESLGKRNNRLEAGSKDSWMCQKMGQVDETVAPLKIKQRSEEEGNIAGKKTVLSSANGNNSSDPPLGANGGVVDIVVPRPETRKNCDGEVGVTGIMAEKKKTIVAGGTKEAMCLLHKDGENQRSNEREDDGKRLKHGDLAIDEIALNLEARMMKVEKTLAKIREWKNIERNQAKNGITA